MENKRLHVETYISTAVPSLKLELRTWRHFDDATEMIDVCAETPLQKRAAVMRARAKEGDLILGILA